MVRRFMWLILPVAGWAFIPPAARAETLATSFELSASKEVPPNNSAATGQAEVTFDTQSAELTWNVQFSGLSGPPIGAHFHGPTDAGKNAGIVVPFNSELESPIRGTATLTPGQAASIKDGKWYINIHTTRHPGGEIRGQVVWQ